MNNNQRRDREDNGNQNEDVVGGGDTSYNYSNRNAPQHYRQTAQHAPPQQYQRPSGGPYHNNQHQHYSDMGRSNGGGPATLEAPTPHNQSQDTNNYYGWQGQGQGGGHTHHHQYTQQQQRYQPQPSSYSAMARGPSNNHPGNLGNVNGSVRQTGSQQNSTSRGAGTTSLQNTTSVTTQQQPSALRSAASSSSLNNMSTTPQPQQPSALRSTTANNTTERESPPKSVRFGGADIRIVQQIPVDNTIPVAQQVSRSLLLCRRNSLGVSMHYSFAKPPLLFACI